MTHRLQQLVARPGRTLLGVTGAPGAGKSTLAAAVADAVPGAVVVPMDGFHHTTADLAARDWVGERGTPRTFDADAFVAMLRALCDGGEVRVPAFDRGREEPVPDAITVPADAPLVVVEGNYLLLDDEPWRQIRELLDAVWYVEVPEQLRLERLVARHVAYGRAPDEALQRATHGSDAANARLVESTRPRADAIVDAAEFLL